MQQRLRVKKLFYIKLHFIDEWSMIAPVRILSFDIECAANKGFPNAERDPII